MSILLETARLQLRTLNESHAPEVWDFVVRNKIFLAEWEVRRKPDYYTVETQRELLSHDRIIMEYGQLFKVWISKRIEPSRIIGSIGLSNIVGGAFLSCHLGYRMDENEAGKGYMTEAMRAVIRHAFQEMLLHRIEANVMPRNKASLRVVEKLGFEYEGLARKYLKINGKWEDHVHMTLLNEELE